MATLVTRVREVIAAVSDDFFDDSTLAYYLSATKKQVASTYLRLERNKKRSFRALDKLRKTQSLSLGSPTTFTAKGDAFEATVQTTIPVLKYEYILYGSSTPVAEIKTEHLHGLELGNIIPTKYENYYTIAFNARTETPASVTLDVTTLANLPYPINADIGFSIKVDGVVIASKPLAVSDPALADASEFATWLRLATVSDPLWEALGGTGANIVLTSAVDGVTTYNNLTVTLEADDVVEKSGTTTGGSVSIAESLHLYTHEQDATKSLTVHYLSLVDDVAVTDTLCADFPDRLVNLFVYGAAVMAVSQEGIKDPENNLRGIVDLYTKELEVNAY